MQQFRKAINKAEGGQFKVRDYGEPTAFLELEIERNRAARSLLLHQQQYVRSMVERYDIDVTHPVPTPFALGVKLPAYDPEMATVDSTEYRSIVGSLQYAAVGSRPNIAFQVMSLARQLSAANVVHLDYAKQKKPSVRPYGFESCIVLCWVSNLRLLLTSLCLMKTTKALLSGATTRSNTPSPSTLTSRCSRLESGVSSRCKTLRYATVRRRAC